MHIFTYKTTRGYLQRYMNVPILKNLNCAKFLKAKKKLFFLMT